MIKNFTVSALYPELTVSKEIYIVGLLRKPEGLNPNHVFIIVEGRNDSDETIFRRYDLVINKEKKDEHGQYLASIIIKHYTVYDSEHTAPVELLKETILNGDDFYATCWTISKEQANKLHEKIKIDSDHSGLYNYVTSGKYSSAAFFVKGHKEKHNCYTWACQTLNSISTKQFPIEIPVNIHDYLASLPFAVIRKTDTGVDVYRPSTGFCLLS